MVIGTPTVLNLIPGGVMKVIHVNQVNENIEIQFRIMNGAQPFNVPEGVSCTIRGTKGDNFGYAADVAVTAGSNIVTVTLTEQLTAVAGAGNIFELVFVGASDDMKVSTENFLLDVERAALGEDTVISDSDLAYADQVLDQLQSVGAVNAQVQQNKANIAAEITRATAAEQTLQQNINAEASSRATTDALLQSQINQMVAPSGSAPSAAEVENARIGSDGTVYPTLGEAIRTQNSILKSQLSNLIYDTIGTTTNPITLTADTRTNTASSSFSSSEKTGYQTAVVDCVGGDVFDIYADTQSTSYNTYAFYASGSGGGYTRLSGWATTLSGKTRVTAPSNAVKLIVNNNSTYVAYPTLEKINLDNDDALKVRLDSVESIVAKNMNHIAFLRRGINYNTIQKVIEIPEQQMFYDGTRSSFTGSRTVDVSSIANYFALIFNSETQQFSAVTTNFTLTDKQYIVGAFDAREPSRGFVFGELMINKFMRQYGYDPHSYVGTENVASDWWIYPIATRYKAIRDKVYTGFITNSGLCGVIAVDVATKQIQRYNLYVSDAADEHNSPSVSILPNGKVMVICTNHATSPYHNIYISAQKENIQSFTRSYIRTSHDGVTYSQVVKMGTTYYLFYRAHDYVEGSTTTDKYHWCVRTSTDGLTWSEEVTWLTGGTVQYYMLARQYDSTHIKVYMQGNASGSYTDIRLCYIDTTTGDILDTDMSTVLGNLGTLAEPISYESFTVILAKTSTHKNRLLSVAPGTDLSFTCGRIVSASNYEVYIYRYVNGSWTANTIPDVGASFGGGTNSTYINHAEIVNVEDGVYTVIYAAQTASGWELRKVVISSAAGTPTVIESTDSGDRKLIRPFKIVDDSAVIATRGEWTNYTNYNEDFVIVDY